MNDPMLALRDLLDGQLRDHGRRLRGFTDPDWQRYADLLAGAFLLAVRRRFAPGPDQARVIRFVATARERYDPTGVTLDPAFAEELVRAALLDDPPPVVDAVPVDEAVLVDGAVPVSTGALVTAQSLLLLALLEDEGTSADGNAELLSAAGRLVRPSGPARSCGADRVAEDWSIRPPAPGGS
ncbi:hypothetical protein V6U90_07870 [Micromonospora sp. CPCC 206060]|uniref:hypothetical protein n=1 Tax=Micromonospora sp. CPCC 206060 TaxID=3122406 RepID=UPI002FF0C3B2